MKKLAIIASIFLTVSTFTLSVYAMGGGMGGGMSGGTGGNGIMSNFGSSLLDWLQKWRNGNESNHPVGRDRRQIEELDRQHYEDSAYLKYQIQMKEKELDALLKTTDPDIEKVRAIHKDIQELISLADQEQHNYELEAGKNSPEYRSDGSDNWYSYGSPESRERGKMGYNRGMGGYGQGR